VQVKVEEVKARNATQAAQIRNSSAEADHMLAQRGEYMLQQNMQMAQYVRDSTKAGVEASRKQHEDQTKALAEEINRKAKADAEKAEKMAAVQRKSKVDKAARVQAARAGCRDNATKLSEEKKSAGAMGRQRIAEEESMLQQRDAYFAEVKRSMHDEVKSRSEACKEQIALLQRDRQAESARMKEEQAAKSAAQAEHKNNLMQKRREKALAIKDSMAEKTRKSVQDLKDSKKQSVEKDRSDQAQHVGSYLSQQQSFNEQLKAEEQHLLDQLAQLQQS